jgi:hypothetical protein
MRICCSCGVPTETIFFCRLTPFRASVNNFLTSRNSHYRLFMRFQYGILRLTGCESHPSMFGSCELSRWVPSFRRNMPPPSSWLQLLAYTEDMEGVECFSETSGPIYLSTCYRNPVYHIMKLHFRKNLITSADPIRVIVCSGYDREMTHMPFDICPSSSKRTYIAHILQPASSFRCYKIW